MSHQSRCTLSANTNKSDFFFSIPSLPLFIYLFISYFRKPTSLFADRVCLPFPCWLCNAVLTGLLPCKMEYDYTVLQSTFRGCQGIRHLCQIPFHPFRKILLLSLSQGRLLRGNLADYLLSGASVGRRRVDSILPPITSSPTMMSY